MRSIGGPGAGKSVLLNNALGQLAGRDDVRLWIVDPADGVDLGVWHELSFRLAETPDNGISLFGKLLTDLGERRQPRPPSGP